MTLAPLALLIPSLNHPLRMTDTQKMTRDFYAKITNPDEEQHNSDDDAPPPAPARAASHTATGVPGDAAGSASGYRRASTTHRGSSAVGQSVEPDDEEDGQGVDENGQPSAGGIKRGTYMKNGPTVYKLVKPVLKIIKETKAKE